MKHPFLSIIVVVEDENRGFLEPTLETIRLQKEVSLEIVIVDGRKSYDDRLLYLKNDPLVSHLFCAWDLRSFALHNKGAFLAKGEYLHFLAPGQYYLFEQVIKEVKKALLLHKFPDLLMSAYVIRHFLAECEPFLKQLTVNDLYIGKAPISLYPLWIRREFFNQNLGFNPYDDCLCLDLLSRVFLHQGAKLAFLPRVLIDYEYRKIAPSKILHQYLEAFGVLLWHFGPRVELFKWLKNNMLSVFLWVFRTLKAAFLGKKVAYKRSY